MNITEIKIGELPPEIGPAGKRLIVVVDNKYYESVLVGNPMTIDCAIEKLELLAFNLKRLKAVHGRKSVKES